MALELLPIGTILAVVTNQVVKTAHAANDILIEKASFKVLAKHLLDIEPVLKELQAGKLNESPGARQALEFLKSDVKKANNLVEKYKNRARFYLLIKSRHIVKEVQDVTRDIGRSLNALSLVNGEVLLGISDQVDRLQNEMQRAELETCHSRVQILEKLNQGLTGQNLDQGFVNDLLKDIACAVGVSIDPSEISKEMESFRREKEEAAIRKERAEVFFLEQVIELLSRADAAKDYEQVKDRYLERIRVIERYDPKEEYIEPFKAFVCGITQRVMVDPVSLCNGTAYERGAIEAWFESGARSDPVTGDFLEDLTYRSNIQLRHSIQEWKELNYCVKIRSCKGKLLSGVESSIKEALEQMQGLIEENSITKDWFSTGGLTEVIICILGTSQNEYVKREVLITLKDIVEGQWQARNKDLLVDNKGLEHIVPCLGCESGISKAAIELLYELLQDRSGQNLFYTRFQQCNPVPFLVAIVNSSDRASSDMAEEILVKLCDIDDNNIILAAKLNWFKPLINQIIQGSGLIRKSMARALVTMELDEEKVKLLGDRGLIVPLLEMALTDLESKEVALSLIVKLSGCQDNKRLIASAGGVPIILEVMTSSHLRTLIIARCSEIIEKLSSNGDGVKYLVNENGQSVDLESVVTTLLAFQQNPNTSHIIKKPSLQALLGICQSEAKLVKTAVLSAEGVSLVLPLLDHSDIGIRETAINLLFLFSNHEPQGVAEYLLKPRRLEALIGLLEDHSKSDVQKAAAGLLANLPKSEISLTKKLIELDGLKAIIDILSLGTMDAKENALNALFRFTDPTNLEFQKKVVEFGAYPLLVNILKRGSVTAKARAAGLVGDLSLRSSELTNIISRKFKCLSFHRAHILICPAHGGICSMNKSFCMLESKALPEIVKLLHGQVHATAYEAIQSLSTLVQEESPRRGAHVLHENDAIGPILEVLEWGSESLKEEALGLLEKIFMLMEMGDIYGARARLVLIRMTGRSFHEEGHLQRKAARVLLMIERCSRSSRSLVTTAPSG